MDNINYLSVAFHISAFLICLSCIVFTLIQGRADKPQKKLYLSILFILLLNSVSETVIEFITPIHLQNPAFPYVLMVCKYFYFLLHPIILPLLGYYVFFITGKMHLFTPKRHIIFEAPITAILLLLLTNPIHNFCYYYDANAVYHRGAGVLLLYIFSAFYVLFSVTHLFASLRAMTPKRRIALTYFVAMVMIGVGLQLVFIRLRVEIFAESIAFLGLLLTVEDEGDLTDTEIGIYNRKALRMDLNSFLANKQTFYLICIKIENVDTIRRITGSENTDLLTKTVFMGLVKFVPRYYIYQSSPDTFIMLIHRKTPEEAKDLLKHVCNRFKTSWDFKYTSYILSATTIFAELPADLSSAEEVFNMADSSLPREHKSCLIGKSDLEYLLRRKAVESALHNALKEGSFEVYYQALYNANSAKISGAEALVRLYDKKIGDITPNEFIPLAEQFGIIGEIDDFVLSRVCDFVSTGKPKELGIESINVNLSVLQCIQPGFAEHIIEIVDRHGADHSVINFEITESVDATDYGIMKSVIEKFRDKGFRVYMDDYGTGYSNVQTLFSMDFNVIKIDKSILWGAEKSQLGRIILESTVRMLRQMNLGVLVEGVETQNQVDLLESLGVDYLQGFYYSRPVPENEFVDLLSNKKAIKTIHKYDLPL